MKKCHKLTGDKDLDLFAEYGADSIACDALVDAGVFPPYRLNFVNRLRGELCLENAVLHPSVFRLGIAWANRQLEY